MFWKQSLADICMTYVSNYRKILIIFFNLFCIETMGVSEKPWATFTQPPLGNAASWPVIRQEDTRKIYSLDLRETVNFGWRKENVDQSNFYLKASLKPWTSRRLVNITILCLANTTSCLQQKGAKVSHLILTL